MAAASPASHRILLVDPEEEFLAWAGKHLSAPGIETHGETNAESAFKWFVQYKPSVVVAELSLQPFSGLDLLKKLRLQDPSALVILVSGSPPSSVLIEAMRLGGYDFLRKSALSYELRPAVESALQTSEAMRGEKKSAAGTQRIDPEHAGETLIGESSAMQEVFKLVGRVSRSEAPVLITGESGCGKEVVARAVHRFSSRSSRPFVAINCAAIPETLLESELFGHEKGSFTGAMQQRVGRFEQCDGGTLFLDEIGEMPILVQSKLLRVLQEGEFSRVGGNQTLKTSVRIIAATNRDPERAIDEGRFREDLFYRLNVVRVHLPPLREREADIIPLARFFLSRLSRQRPGGKALAFADSTLELLKSYNWPGNVRELENVIQRAAVLATGNIIMPKDLPLDLPDAAAGADDDADGSSGLEPHLERLLREAMSGGQPALPALAKRLRTLALRLCNGNISAANALVGTLSTSPAKKTARAKSSKSGAPERNRTST